MSQEEQIQQLRDAVLVVATALGTALPNTPELNALAAQIEEERAQSR